MTKVEAANNLRITHAAWVKAYSAYRDANKLANAVNEKARKMSGIVATLGITVKTASEALAEANKIVDTLTTEN